VNQFFLVLGKPSQKINAALKADSAALANALRLCEGESFKPRTTEHLPTGVVARWGKIIDERAQKS